MATGLKNPLMEDRGFFANTADSLKNRWLGKGTEGVSKAFDEGNYPRAALRALGVAAGSVGDVLAAPVDAIFEATGLNAKIEALVKMGLDTETGKKLLKAVQENPEYAADVGAAFDTLSVIPAAKLTKNVINDVMHNVATKVEGGVPGDALHAARTKVAEMRGVAPPERPNFYNSFAPALVAGSAVDGLWGAVNDRFNPFAMAKTDASGFTTNRRREIRNAMAAGNELDAAGSASAGRMLNQQRYGTETPMYAKGSPLHQYQYVATDIPAANLDEIRRRIGAADIPASVTDRHMKDFQANMLSGTAGWDEKLNSLLNPATRGTTVDVVNPNAFKAHAEMADLPMDRAPGTSINKMFTEERIADLPEGTSAFELSKAAKTADSAKWRMLNGMGGKIEATKYILKAVEKQKRGVPLTDKEAKALKGYEKTSVKPTDEFGYTHSGSSYLSAQKQFGGVHSMSSVGTDDIYNTVSDNSNLFGMSFVNPMTNKVAIYPTQKRVLGKEGDTTTARKSRFLTREDVNAYADVKKLEEISGVPRKPNEDAVTYQLRAIGEIEKKPGMKQFANVLKNAVWTGYVGTSNDQYQK